MYFVVCITISRNMFSITILQLLIINKYGILSVTFLQIVSELLLDYIASHLRR
jgi:hypothetical protein